MIAIKEAQELTMENLLSFRGKVTQQQMQVEMVKISETLQSLCVKKNGPIATATYSVEQSDEGQIMDIEILVPLDKKVVLPNRYAFKPMVKLVNALCVRHVGHPGTITNTINALNEYIVKYNKQVITATYNVTVKDAKTEAEIKDMIFDLYVGCNPCVV